MGMNFPNSPIQGQVFTATTGLQYVFLDGVWRIVEAPQDIGKAEARNRIVNGAMQISQENGTTGSSADGYYPVDQWLHSRSSSSTVTAAKVGNQISVVASPAEAAAAAGEYIQLVHNIEGTKLSDFGLGTGASKQFVIAFDAYYPVAGTYWVAIGTPTGTHTWLGSYTISAGEVNTYARKTVVVPAGAINAGTWPVDNSACLTIHFTLHCGSTYVGTAGFQAANKLAGPGQALGLSTASPCYLTNVGLYLDPQNTGIAPPWQMPDEAEELRACKRYWQSMHTAIRFTAGGPGWANDYTLVFPVQPRVAPATAVTAGARVNVASTTVIALSSFAGIRHEITNTATGDCYAVDDKFTFNARM